MVTELTRPEIRDRFKDSFFALLASPRRSGKSTLLKHLVRSFKPGRFSAVYVFSPTAHLQPKLFSWGATRIIQPNKDTFSAQIQSIIEFQRERIQTEREVGEVLIVCDDLFSSSQRGFGVGAVSSALEILASRGRHTRIATILLTQRIQSVSPSIRSNADILVSFYPRTESHRETLIRDFLSRENTATRKKTRQRATEIMGQVFDGGAYRALVVFPDSNGKQLEDITRWIEAPAKSRPFTIRLRQIIDVDDGTDEPAFDFIFRS